MRHGRRMRGRGVMDVIKKVIGFFRKHKISSRGGSALGGLLPGKYGVVAHGIGKAAGSVGFGRRRRRGRGLRLAGH